MKPFLERRDAAGPTTKAEGTHRHDEVGKVRKVDRFAVSAVAVAGGLLSVALVLGIIFLFMAIRHDAWLLALENAF